jgi:hypothetical protein
MRRVVGRWIALFFFPNWINATARERLVPALASVVSSATESCMIQEEREIKWSSDTDVLCLVVAIDLE